MRLQPSSHLRECVSIRQARQKPCQKTPKHGFIYIRGSGLGRTVPAHFRIWGFAARETLVARASARAAVHVRRQTAHLVVHSEHGRAVNRLPPRGRRPDPTQIHGALLAHESTVEL
eukprot:6807425-Prymnesium_polylepis.1